MKNVLHIWDAYVKNIITTSLSNHRVDIHFALWRLHKNAYLSYIVMHVYSKIKHVKM